MRVQVMKWGHSLALRIPKAFAMEIGLAEHAPVDLALVDGRLIVEPILENRLTLDELLAGVTAENLHLEIDTGTRVGREEW